jgi:hypothetical protein
MLSGHLIVVHGHHLMHVVWLDGYHGSSMDEVLVMRWEFKVSCHRRWIHAYMCVTILSVHHCSSVRRIERSTHAMTLVVHHTLVLEPILWIERIVHSSLTNSHRSLMSILVCNVGKEAVIIISIRRRSLVKRVHLIVMMSLFIAIVNSLVRMLSTSNKLLCRPELIAVPSW